MALAFGVLTSLALLGTAWTPGVGTASTDIITTCLQPCHSPPALFGPDIATGYLGSGRNAGHLMDWTPRVIESTSGATLPQGSRMPCSECHVTHGTPTTSIYNFNSSRVGAPITVVRQLCEGCHRPYDSATSTPTVCGLKLKKLPSGVTDHRDASNRPCSDCHGPSAHDPQGHGGGALDCGDSLCHGGTGSHAIHLQASDLRGPGAMACTDCHKSDEFPHFKSGTDANGDGWYSLGETDACDTCHSRGGSYNGVVSTRAPSGALSVGAKDNWATKVYETLSSLKPGKEKWCAGCHDGVEGASGKQPSLIGGAYAPTVAGDETATYTYGTGYGFYKTGHGVPTSTVIPSNGANPGPGLECDACHNFNTKHIDGDRRTFSASGGTPATYRAGYRLDLVGSAEPMAIPWTGLVGNALTQYRLCTMSGCHNANPSPYVTAAARSTNFWNDARADLGYNMHAYHLGFTNSLRWAPDWGSTMNSRITCPTCHNVHGSTRLAMIHDGELISDTVNRRPGLEIYYYKAGVTSWGSLTPPQPANVTLAMSEGWVWKLSSGDNLCSDCHGGNWDLDLRALWRSYAVAPVLKWAGTYGFEDDGANPDSGPGYDGFTFRISYWDANNDAPSYVRLRIDQNDDGDYVDAGETATLTADSPVDTSYYDGKLYSTSLQLVKAGDNVLPYYFETHDGVTGPGVSPTRTVTIVNATPRLPWTGETGYTNDGVNPNSGTTGITNYQFRIKYVDTDGEAPVGGVSLRVDKNDDGDMDDVGETVVMTDMGDPSFIVGKRYSHTATLTRQSDDTIAYFFTATDGIESTRTATATVSVLQNINQAPVLAWTGESGYVTDGVNPDYQAGNKPFYFRVKYTDANNDAPGTRQVWIDFNDNASYEPGEKFTMDDSVTATDATMTDSDYSNGEILAKKIYVPFAGDGTLKYCFYFVDSQAAEATGVQLTDRNLGVFNAVDVPGDGYGSIQAAVTAASNGQTVLVADGTWAPFAFNNKDITVESINGPATTIIQGSGSGTIVDFNTWSGNSTDSTLTGFTVRNGTQGINVSSSTARLVNCIIENNVSYGVQHTPASPYFLTVDACIIRNNTGPGIYVSNNTAPVTIRDSSFISNTAASGGGIRTNGGTMTVERSVFSGNRATVNNGGAINFGGTITLTMRDCTVTGNTAVLDGGGFYFPGAAATNPTVERTVFVGNSAANGGAIRTGQGNYYFTNCTMSGNRASSFGGAVLVQSGTNVNFTNCTMAANEAVSGGAIRANTTTNGHPKIHNCVLWGNNSSGSTYEQIDSDSDVNRNRVQVQYTDIEQIYTSFFNQTGNMTADPLFVSPNVYSTAPTTTGDYHLRATPVMSPCEGAASAGYAPGDDIDRGSRPVGSGFDMGSDEINSTGGGGAVLGGGAKKEATIFYRGTTARATLGATTRALPKFSGAKQPVAVARDAGGQTKTPTSAPSQLLVGAISVVTFALRAALKAP